MSKPELQAAFSEKAGSKGHHRADYAGMIAAVDNNVGRLMDKLSELGLYRKTLVIFTSDNGGLCDVTKQYPLRAGKGTYYEGGIRVPLIVRWPDVIKSGYQADARVSQLDFYPTLQSLVQPARPAEQLDGQNILPLLQGKTLPQRDLYFHFPVYLEAGRDKEGLPDSLFRTRPGSVVISGDWKLHHYFEDNRLELYDLAGDPGENNNLATARSELVQSLYAKLDTWRKTTGAPIPEQLNPEYSGR